MELYGIEWGKAIYYTPLCRKQLIHFYEINNTPGLSGKMGWILYLFKYSRLQNCTSTAEEAHCKLEKLLDEINTNIPLNYADGLWGIGCGVEYLLRAGYLEGDADELLGYIDEVAMNVIDFRYQDNASIRYGASGVGYYLYRRMIGREDNTTLIGIKEYLIYLLDWLEVFYPIMQLQEKKEVYYFLHLLEQTRFYRTKVRLLIDKLNT